MSLSQSQGAFEFDFWQTEAPINFNYQIVKFSIQCSHMWHSLTIAWRNNEIFGGLKSTKQSNNKAEANYLNQLFLGECEIQGFMYNEKERKLQR